MKRHFTKHANSRSIEHLNVLIDQSTPPDKYQQSMFELGKVIGTQLSLYIPEGESVILVSTVEDADYLSKGILQELENNENLISLCCYWNNRLSIFNNQKIAPIIRQYEEPIPNNCKYIIVVKSIISGACVVKTNLLKLIEEAKMVERIFVVAPVILHGAEERLKKDFNSEVYDKFQFVYLAEDQEKDEHNNVDPGIGGNVYVRLGFRDQDEKNHYMPNIVRERQAL